MNILYRVIVGSFAYGTYIEGRSDYDYKGIYQQSAEELLGYDYEPQIKLSKDEEYYEIKRFLDLAESANPTVLELLYMPEECILNSSPILNVLFENRDKFLTKRCKDSFNGYVRKQMQKAQGLDKKQNWERAKFETRKTALDFCYIVLDSHTAILGQKTVKQGTYPLIDWLCKKNLDQDEVYVNKLNHTKEGYQLYHGRMGGLLSKDGTRLKTPSSPISAVPIGTVMFGIDAFRQHCKDFDSYQTWLKERNEERYVDYESHGQSFDGKNLLHCRRLINVAKEIATKGTINVRRPKDEVEHLLAIRRGEVDLSDIIKEVEEDIKTIDDLFNKSDLPEEVNPDLKKDILLQIRGVR